MFTCLKNKYFNLEVYRFIVLVVRARTLMYVNLLALRTILSQPPFIFRSISTLPKIKDKFYFLGTFLMDFFSNSKFTKVCDQTHN